ncbi:MAG TPA: DUF3418 domain-containing protein, partial [Phycisphaerae bacterium]
YRFDPGEPADGLTLALPIAALAALRPERYEWLVPGMLEDKIAAMLRELPGALRRNFVPVPAWAKSAAEALAAVPTDSDISLRQALATFLGKQSPVEITAADFVEESLPPFLRMAFRVLDDSGKILATSRDLPKLQRELAKQTAGSFAALHDPRFSRTNITTWDFPDLPESLTIQRHAMSIVAYPALTESADSEFCSLRLFPARDAAEQAHRVSLRRLLRLGHRREVKSLAAHLPHFPQMALQHFTLGESRRLREDLVTLVIDRALFADAPVPRTRVDWEPLQATAAERLIDTGNAIAALALSILENYHLITLALDHASRKVSPPAAALSDLREQLLHMVPAHFLLSTPFEWIQQYPRYLAAMRLRLEKLDKSGPEVITHDAAAMEQIVPLWNQYLHRKNHLDQIAFRDPELVVYRWMLEEFRVHLFAQELGTFLQVSPKRLEKQFAKIRH